jgi:Flp pilus assembly protein TadD
MFLMQKGQLNEALAQYVKALQIRPDFVQARTGAGAVLAQQGRTAEAIGQYREALRLAPDNGMALNNLAWILATYPDPKFRDGVEAVRLAERAVQLTKQNDAQTLDTLAAAYAEAGRFGEAVKVAQRAMELAEATGQKELTTQLRHRLELYERKQPYYE